jgi:hypothetical protein
MSAREDVAAGLDPSIIAESVPRRGYAPGGVQKLEQSSPETARAAHFCFLCEILNVRSV